MFVPFDTLPPSSRIWVYQADRQFSVPGKTIIDAQLKLFTDGWAAHGHPLKASYKIVFDQFIIIAADEGHYAPSGCSIDNSVYALQQLSAEVGVDFFNRNLIAFLINDVVSLISLQELKKAYTEGKWNADTLMFNNVVANKGDLDAKWVIPASASWLKRYLNHQTIAH